MTTFLFYDAAYPPATSNVPVTNGVCIYSGGDTPHVWTSQEIAAQPARYRLPIFVRSNPSSNNPAIDASAMLGWLAQYQVPYGTATVLDLEMAVDPAYVSAYGAYMHDGGYLVLPYGSLSTLFSNPVLDGYFVSNPTGYEHIVGGTVATQWAFAGGYDLDDVLTSVKLWDTHPTAPTPPPPPQPVHPASLIVLTAEEALMQINVDTDTKGYGWADLPIPAGYAINGAPSILVGQPGVVPANFEGEAYDLASAAYAVGAAAGSIRVTVRMGLPSIQYGVDVPLVLTSAAAAVKAASIKATPKRKAA